MPGLTLHPASQRREITPRSRNVLSVLIAATCALLLGQLLVSPVAAFAETGDTTVLDDPQGSGISVAVDPGDLVVKQGDVVRLHFTGLEAGEYVYALGTCPAGLPGSDMDPSPFAGQLACSSRIPTGLSGDTDPASLNTPGLSTSTFLAYPRADGSVDIDYFVGSGTSVGTLGYQVVLANGDREPHPSLTCDEDNACTIGFVVQRKDGITAWTDLTSLEISPPPADAGAATGCQGLSATSTVSAVGPERLQTPLATLNRAFCGAAASPIPVSYVPAGSGEDDPTGVAAVGASTDLAFVGSPALARKPLAAAQIAIPIALNSVAVGQLGGLTAPSLSTGQLAYNGVDPGGLALTASDLARIVLHDFPTAIPADLPTTPAEGTAYNPLAEAILSRPGNSESLGGLDPSMIGLPFVVAPTVTYSVGTDSTAVALSSFLADSAAADWSFPANAVNDDLGRSGDAVGRISGFDPLVDRSTVATGTVLTSQTSSVGGLYSAKASKDITSGAWANTCPLNVSSTSIPAYQRALTKGCVRFAVMDGGTAASVSTTAVRLANAGGYVAPTTASQQAAAAGSLDADGIFGADDADAYPMTFVEYAVVPKAPLLDDACAARGQQKVLKDFLTYAVGDGQAVLPDGFAPLTTSLVDAATKAIASLGSGTPAGACAPKPAPAPKPSASPSTSAGSTGSPSSGSGSGTGNSGGGFGGGSSAGTGGAGSDPTVVADGGTGRSGPLSSAQPVANLAAAPFQGAAGSSSTSVVVGLLLLGVLMAAAGLGAGSGVSLSRLRRGFGARR